MSARYMLTTVDNPFNPFTHFREWYVWDDRAGYNTVAFLGRIVRTSDELSELEQEQAVEDGIDEIVSQNVSGMWRKVSQESWPSSV